MLRFGNRTPQHSLPLVMAIVNRTPDSFFDKGATWATDAAFDRVDEVVEQGADIVDIGGVKAAPGSEIAVAEEIDRVAAFVTEVRQRHPQVIISVDTYRREVAAAVAEVGADILNDAWGGWDPGVAEVAAQYQLGLVCTHAGGITPRTRPHRVAYTDVVSDVIERTTAEAIRAERLGVPKSGIVIDPGHDFAKNTRQTLLVTRELDQMVATNWPVLVSLSNKDFVGETLDLPVDQRLTGTLAATAICAWHGARIFRVHQVVPTQQVLRMVAAIKGEVPPLVNVRGLA